MNQRVSAAAIVAIAVAAVLLLRRDTSTAQVSPRPVSAPTTDVVLAQQILAQATPLPREPQGRRAAHCADGMRHPRCPFRIGSPTCDRFVIQNFATAEEVAAIREFADAAMSVGVEGEGGVTLVDVAHGIVSYGKRFASLYKLLGHKAKSGNLGLGITPQRMAIYETVVNRIKQVVTARFLEAEGTSIHLAQPAFVSKITNATAAITNDEYWHVHVDTDQYGTFDVTTLLYLSDWVEEASDVHAGDPTTSFSGGTFDFVDSESDEEVANVLAVPPEAGMLLVFTSGSEHPHRVSPVTTGTRYAMTTAFTCDPTKAPPAGSAVLDDLRSAVIL